MAKTLIHIPESILTSLKGKITAMNGKHHNVLLDVGAGNGKSLTAIKSLIETKNTDAIKTLGLTNEEHIDAARKALDVVWINPKKQVMMTHKSVGFMLFNESSKLHVENTQSLEFQFLKSPYQDYQYFSAYAHHHAVIAIILDRQDMTNQMVSSLVRRDLLCVWPISDRKIFIMFQDVPKKDEEQFWQKSIQHPVLGECLKGFITGKVSLLTPKNNDIPTFQIPQGTVKTFRPYKYDMDDIIHLNTSNDKAASFIKKVLGNQTKISPPLMPVSVGHIVTAVIPSGLLNGSIKTDVGEMHLKGTTYHQVIVKKQTGRDRASQENKIASRKIKQSEITALDMKRNILHRIKRDAGVQSVETIAGEVL